jgi:predicted metal-dependent phosphoesterase TrpH
MKKYDLHVHTRYSKCSNMKPEVVLKAAKKRGLNGIAITDHHSIKGALEVKELNKDPNFEVIIGEEIKTRKGEILGLYLKEKIIPGKFEDVIKEIKKQGGIAILAHPYATIGVARKRANGKIFEAVDALEGFNARSILNLENKRAQARARRLNLPMTGGSDGHLKFEVGRAYTEFEGTLKDAIKNKKTRIHGNNWLAIPAMAITGIYRYFIRSFLK